MNEQWKDSYHKNPGKTTEAVLLKESKRRHLYED